MNIYNYPNPQATAVGIIETLLIPRLEAAPTALAVSGGSTPRLLFELMASPDYRERLRWEHLRLYWVDERCVPPTDEQSNYGMTAKALDLEHLPVPKEYIYRIKGEQSPAIEAQAYTELVEQTLPRNAIGLPIFDLILLGIGDDGHTSSIFPHQMHWLTEGAPYVVAEHPNGQARICLTGQTILAARAIAFHAVGAGKASILQAIRDHTPEAEAYPAAYFARERADVMLFTDSL